MSNKELAKAKERILLYSKNHYESKSPALLVMMIHDENKKK
ncbi:hypothetical protein ACFQ4J_09105 [Laceyella tengchongensis]